jgi:hypothetical protein
MAKEAAAKVEPTPTQEPTPEATPVSASTPAADPKVPAGKVQIPDPEPTSAPPGLQLSPEIKTWLEQRSLPADENGLKMILGHIDQEIIEAHQAQEKVRQEHSKRQMGDARSRIRDKVHNAVEERLKGFHGKGLEPDTLEVLKELAWAVTDQSLMMSAAMNQAHTAEELARIRQEDRELWSLLRDPQYEPLLNQAFEIQELSRRFNLPADKVAEIARVLQPRPERADPRGSGRQSRARGHTEVGGGYPIDEGRSQYDKLEKAMDALMKDGRNPSEIFKKHYNFV